MELDVEPSDVPETLSIEGAGLRLSADRWKRSGASGKYAGVVLLLHGGGQTRHSWRRTGERLAAAGWIAYAVDLRGHGDSEWDESGNYGMSIMTEDVRLIIQHVRNEHGDLPVALVGASLGGKVSLIAIGEDSELAQALVLVDIAVRVEVAGGQRVRQFMTSAPDGFGSLQEASAAVSAYNPRRRPSGNLEGLKKNLRLRDGRWHWHWDPRVMFNDDAGSHPDTPVSAVIYERSRRAARNITCPVLLVRGKESDVVSDEGVAEMRELIPHAHVVDVRDAGHMVAGDDNDIFTASLLGYLDQSIRALASESAKGNW
ncbi:alpha/beta fold hydrolase [Rhodococcus opacus]|uniref:Putative hydrolase n=1 Tax=Rhodococcus opacus (strain B4) TaxID=632772 RepID=C1B613_RHOOB|nr:alpha/beta hydrolase [Rhodococcus opacus]BAH55424.1 putative hydrolase [Rhodococcus opacus B4]